MPPIVSADISRLRFSVEPPQAERVFLPSAATPDALEAAERCRNAVHHVKVVEGEHIGRTPFCVIASANTWARFCAGKVTIDLL